MRVEQLSEDVTLYCGDCREVLPTLERVDAVVTDPPWGLGELSGTTSKIRNRNSYQSFDDTEENIKSIVVPAIHSALALSNGRALAATGVRCMWFYPRPRAVGGFYQPAAVGMSPWGFAGFNPVLFYGKDPRDGKGQSSVMTRLTAPSSCNEHPCAKPLFAMLWMVSKATLDGGVILDPFMGSGTTGVACVQLGRKFIGIELEPRYFDIARRRISDELKRPRLDLGEPVAKPVQEALL
jgi:site-specific DNA-methyltransferase (adenine-specific)